MATPIDKITAALRSAVGGAIQDSSSTLDEAASTAGSGVSGAVQSVFGGGWSLTDLLLAIPVVGEIITAPETAPFAALFSKVGKFVEGIAAGWALGSFFTEAARPLYRPISHAIESEVTSEIFDAPTAAQLYVRGLMEHGHAADEATGTGFDGDHFDRFVALNTVHIQLGELLELWRRQEITVDDVRVTLKRNGYSDQGIESLLALRQNILAAPDLALALLRGNIDQARFDAGMARVGVSADDAQVIVGNTGEPPGIMQLLEAYRRGFIDRATLERGIRQSRVRDEWIPTIEKLRFAPMDVSDAARAVVQGYMDQTEADKIAEDNGLAPGFMDTVVKIQGEPLSHEQMLSLFHRGLVTEADVKQSMRESHLKDKYIDDAIQLGRRLLPERQIVTALEHNAITDAQAMEHLAWLGYSADDSKILINSGRNAAIGREKELAKGDVLALYVEYAIDQATARHMLQTLGYHDDGITLLLEIADFRRTNHDVTQVITALHKLYVERWIDEQEVKADLGKLGVPSDRIRHMLPLWTLDRDVTKRHLTEAQVARAVKKGTFTPTEGVRKLVAMGYSPADAQILIEDI